MTFKQEQVIKKLPGNNFNLHKTLKEVGYAQSTCNSGSIYQRYHKLTAKYFDENFIRRQYKKVLKNTMEEKDRTNQLRALEGMAKIEAMYTDKTVNETNIVISEENKAILDRYGLSI